MLFLLPPCPSIPLSENHKGLLFDHHGESATVLFEHQITELIEAQVLT